MLSDEDRVSPHGRLPTVVLRLGIRQPLDDESPPVF
jgi:hypothetical protein